MANAQTNPNNRNAGSITQRPTSIEPQQRKNIGLIGVGFFIVSESTFFLGLFLAWFYLRSTSDIWPPAEVVRPPLAPALFNTLIALLATAAILFANFAITRNDRRGLIAGMSIAAALGVVFMAVQAAEFADLSVLAQGSAYGSAFTFLLVFHILRVFVGVALMGVVLVRALLGHFNSERRLLVQATTLYWCFITAVWLVVFDVLYVLN